MKLDLSSIVNKSKVKSPKPQPLPPQQQLSQLSPQLSPPLSPQQQLSPQQLQQLPAEMAMPKELSTADRAKLIDVLRLYIQEFPKLADYKKKNLDKLADDELIELRKTFQSSVSTFNHLGGAIMVSQRALELYEWLMVNIADINITGVSKIGGTPEWHETVKALALKYMDSITFQTEPEMKLAMLLITNTIVAHSINSMTASLPPPQQQQSQPQPPQSQQQPQQTDPTAELLRRRIEESRAKQAAISALNDEFADL